MDKELFHLLLILNFLKSDLDYLTHIFYTYLLLPVFSKNTFTYAFSYDIISFFQCWKCFILHMARNKIFNSFGWKFIV